MIDANCKLYIDEEKRELHDDKDECVKCLICRIHHREKDIYTDLA